MKNYEKIIGIATRVEVEQTTGRVFLIFEIIDEKQKQKIKTNWTDDIEFRLIDKNLVSEEE